MSARLAIAALLVSACGSQIERSEPTSSVQSSRLGVAPAPAPQATGKASSPAAKSVAKPAKQKKKDPLFPQRDKRGWKEIGTDGRLAADAIADDYTDFITVGKTPRRAVSALVERAKDAGARAAQPEERGLTGYHYVVEAGGDSAVFFRSGTAPIEKGASILVVSVDAPRLILKQTPVEQRHGIEILQTVLHGDLDLRTWMVHPMALDVFVDKAGKTTTFSVGEATSDPVLSIPDLLPHLSRGSQRRGKEVADPERLDPISASASGGLARLLRSRGLATADIAQAEAYLVPAASAVRVGVDRALIGGYGHGERALAYAAIRGLGEATPVRPVVVVVVGRSADGGEGTSGYPYVARAVRKAIAALSEAEVDIYQTKLSMSRSAALVSYPSSGKRNSGVIVDIGNSDALPMPARELTTTFAAANVPFVVRDTGYSSIIREIASLDIDTIGLAIPTKGRGSPGETISVLDLYHGVLACRAWLSRSL